MGAISELIQRINGQSVARVASAKNREATSKPAQPLAVARVAPVAPEKDNAHAAPPAVAAPIPVSREYFAGQGVHLLADDLAFLRWHLPKATSRHNWAVERYVAIWKKAAALEPLEHKKANRGRVAANTWLRELHRYVPMGSGS